MIRNRHNAVTLNFSPTCPEQDGEISGLNRMAKLYNHPLSNNGMEGLAKTYEGKPTISLPSTQAKAVTMAVVATVIVMDTVDASPSSPWTRKEPNFSTLFVEMLEGSNVYVKVGTVVWGRGRRGGRRCGEIGSCERKSVSSAHFIVQILQCVRSNVEKQSAGKAHYSNFTNLFFFLSFPAFINHFENLVLLLSDERKQASEQALHLCMIIFHFCDETTKGAWDLG